MKTCVEEMEYQFLRLSRLFGYKLTVVRQSGDRVMVRVSPGKRGRQFKPFTADAYLVVRLRDIRRRSDGRIRSLSE
jgi:hypothetical protein